MAEQKGFFRRIFTFGKDDEPAPAAPAPAEEQVAATQPLPVAAQPDAATVGSDGPAGSSQPQAASVILHDDTPEPVTAQASTPAPPAPPAQGAPTSDATADDDFAFLNSDAPPTLEPADDFAWLEDDTTPPAGEPAMLDPAEETILEEDGGRPADDLDLPAPAPAPIPAPAPAVDNAIAPQDEAADTVAIEDLELAPEREDEFAWLDAPVEPQPEEPDGAAPEGQAPEGWRLREAREAAAGAALAAEPERSWFQRLREGLARSSGQLSGQITSLFTKRRLDDDTLQDFEDVLIQADLGVETATRITERLREGRYGKEVTGDAVTAILAEEVERALTPVARPLELDLSDRPHVILVVGVNGTGKTTTIGKLAAKLTRGGLKVTLGAGDTFRAAAVEQLKIWGERTGSPVVAKPIGADAAGLAFEAYDEAVRTGSDVLIIDTAGRLQNRTELMAELEKIVRVLRKRAPDAPHTVLQTLDATTGQNAMSQVEIFRNVAGVNGLVMTKLDGTARGGILVAIATRHALPVYFIGVGEGIDDLEPFKARDFAQAIAGRAG